MRVNFKDMEKQGYRKLAAIMFTHLADYSALFSENETEALRYLQEHRVLLRELFKLHNGLEIKTIGEEFLVEFESAVEAVECAIDIQTRLRQRNSETPGTLPIRLRIGIHVGDIVHEKGDVFGDGVNIAARLKPLADPGDILITDQVFVQIRNKVEARVLDIGTHRLKNIQDPMKIYRVFLPWQRPSVRISRALIYGRMPYLKKFFVSVLTIGVFVITILLASWWYLSRKGSPADSAGGETGPSLRIAVLPFDNLGGPDDEYFSDGITEEITARLASTGKLGVIARTSAWQYKGSDKSAQQIGRELNVQYILKGDVLLKRNADGSGEVRVVPRLMGMDRAASLWSQVYDKDIHDIFQVQADIAVQVVGALGMTLLDADRGNLASRPTGNIKAYDYYLRGMDYYGRSHEEKDMYTAEQMYQHAVELDPEFALAYARLSEVHSCMFWYFYDRTDERLKLAKVAADRALSIDPELPEAYLALGFYYYWGFLDYENALLQFEVARSKRPEDSQILEATGFVLRRQGKFKESGDMMIRASELDPRSGMLAFEIAGTYLALRHYPLVEQYLDRALKIIPESSELYAWKAWLYLAWKGDAVLAERILEEGSEIMGPEASYYLYLSILVDLYENQCEEALEHLSGSRLPAVDTQYFYYPRALLEARVYRQMGNGDRSGAAYGAARYLLEEKIRSDPEDARFHSSLGIAFAGLGMKDRAVEEGMRAVTLVPVSKEALRGMFLERDLALIFVMAGEHTRAIELLEHLLTIPGILSPEILKNDPAWKPLHSNPDFRAMLETRASDSSLLDSASEL